VSPELLLAALGALLLLTGVLGGGFEIRELRIPRIGLLSRGVSGVMGLGLLLVAVGMAAQPAQPSPTPSPSPSPSSGGSVNVTIHDELGEGQVNEQVNLVMGGRAVGDLTVNREFPEAAIEVTLPSEGRQDYTLQSRSHHLAMDGTEVVIDGSGQGSISVEDGDEFDVQYADNGQARNLTLVERRAG
jgi:hypothetical protein